MSAPALHCEDVRQTYRSGSRAVAALRPVSKSFPAGRVTTIAGPSGSGKSTLLRILACIDRPEGGRVTLGHSAISTLGARAQRRLRRYRLGYLFQDPADNLVEYLTAADQVRLAAELRGARVAAADIVELLARLRLDHRLGHRPFQLSGGEQQRLSIACAVVGGPSVVLADEPTAELDSTSAGLVLDAFHTLTDLGTAFVLTSHDAVVIESSDHLLRLDHGETVESW